MATDAFTLVPLASRSPMIARSMPFPPVLMAADADDKAAAVKAAKAQGLSFVMFMTPFMFGGYFAGYFADLPADAVAASAQPTRRARMGFACWGQLGQLWQPLLIAASGAAAIKCDALFRCGSYR